MKKLLKIAVNFTACIMVAVATLGLSACEDIKTVDLDLSVYNFTDKKWYEDEDVAFSVELYRHLAPKTCDAVLQLINDGYYNDAIFYQETGYTSQIMVGDLKMDENGNVALNLVNGKLPSEIVGAEFELNGTTGSDLVATEGTIGLWRGWYADDNGYKTSSAARNSGRSTLFIPTSSITAYDGYFSIFAKYDVSDDSNATAISALTAIFNNSESYTRYVIFYTGSYNNLKFNAVKETEFNEDYDSEEKTYKGEAVFEAEDQQLVSFNRKTVKIPNLVNGVSAARIKGKTK